MNFYRKASKKIRKRRRPSPTNSKNEYSGVSISLNARNQTLVNSDRENISSNDIAPLQMDKSEISIKEIKSGVPNPNKYNEYFVHKFSLPKVLHRGNFN